MPNPVPGRVVNTALDTDTRMDRTRNTEVRALLERILAEDTLVRSHRNSTLLRYLVTEKLEGRGGEINGTTIAQDVFGKGVEFDPTTDPSVRVQMGRLRKALDSYYDGPGRNETIRIDIPKGSYEPEFRPVVPEADDALPQGAIGSTGSLLESAPVADQRSDPLPSDGQLVSAKSTPATPVPVEGGKRGGAAPDGPFRPARQFMHGRPRSTLAVVAAASLVLLLAGGLAALTLWGGPSEETEINSYPVVIVRPFENRTGDADNDMLSRGFQRQFAADLQRFQTARVALDEPPPSGTPGMLARADFIVTGAILGTEPQLDMLAYLLDVENAEVLDTERLTLEAGDEYTDTVEAFSRTLSGRFGAARGYLSQAVGSVEEEVIGDDLLDADLMAFRCWTAFNLFTTNRTVEQFGPVRDCLARESAKAPEDGTLLAALAWTLLIGSREAEMIDTRQLDGTHSPAYALELAEQAVAVDPGNDVAHAYLGLIQWFNGYEREALASLRRAVQINPADPQHLADYALFLGFSGQWEKSLELAQTAIDWEIDPPGWYSLPFFYNAILKGDGERAKAVLSGGASRHDPFNAIYQLVAAVMTNDDQAIERWRTRVETLSDENGGDPMSGLRKWVRSPQILRVIEDALTEAGLSLDAARVMGARS